MILSRNRSFKREAPSKEAKLFLIACEGERREGDYFEYFEELDSRVKVKVIRPEDGENNSPIGLVDKMEILLNLENSEYEINKDDQIWFVFDTDDWKEKITEARTKIAKVSNYYIAQSNPCFEVWLYFHFTLDKPDFNGIESSKEWKIYVNKRFPGGFDSTKHPILIKDAIRNSEHNFLRDDKNWPAIGSTEVHFLAIEIYKLLSKKLDSARNKLQM